MSETAYAFVARHLIKTYHRTPRETPVCFLGAEMLTPRVRNELRNSITALGFTVLDERDVYSDYGYFHPRKSKVRGVILRFHPERRTVTGQVEVNVSIGFGIRTGYRLKYMLKADKAGWRLLSSQITLRH